MISLKKRQSGFTIVELLIVIVVIAILATLVIVTFTGIQKKARDSQRQTDINAVDSHLEAFYAQNGYYPTANMLNDSAWLNKNMKGLDPEALKDPKATSNDIGSSATAGDTQYAYHALAGTADCPAETGTSPDQVATCDGFTLQAKLEAGGTYDKKSNT